MNTNGTSSHTGGKAPALSRDPFDVMSVPSLFAAALLVGMCAAIVFGAF